MKRPNSSVQCLCKVVLYTVALSSRDTKQLNNRDNCTIVQWRSPITAYRVELQTKVKQRFVKIPQSQRRTLPWVDAGLAVFLIRKRPSRGLHRDCKTSRNLREGLFEALLPRQHGAALLNFKVFSWLFHRNQATGLQLEPLLLRISFIVVVDLS